MAYGLLSNGSYNPYPGDALGGSLLSQNLAKLSTIVPPPATVSVAPPTAADNTAQAIQTGQSVNAQLPGYNQSVANVGANIQSETAGQLPADVVRQIQQAGAERGVATGSPDSPNSNASYLQALGLNSLALTNTGQTNLNSELQNLPGAAISQNPSFYTTPALDTSVSSTNASAQNTANEQTAALNAARAGASAAGVPGPNVVGGLPPTPSYGSAPSGGVVTAPAYGGGSGASQTASLLSDIANTYGSIFQGGDGTPESGTNDATGRPFVPTADENGEFAEYDG